MTPDLIGLANDPRRGFSALDLGELSALFSALESLAAEMAPHISAVADGLVEALGEKAARILCQGAQSPAEVARRFFRLQAAVTAAELVSTPRLAT